MTQRGTYESQSEFARRYFARRREEERQKGLLEGRRTALFVVLDARGLKVDAATRRLIQACTDVSQLKLCLHMAVTIEPARKLFSNKPTPKLADPRAAKSGRSTKASKPRSKK